MDNALYKRNVMSTLSVAGAKLGMKQVIRQTPRMNVFHAAIGLCTEVGELVQGLAPYLDGSSKITDQMKVNAFEECGDIGYYLTVVSKFLKVKLPGAGKKVKFKGITRTQAVHQLVVLASMILDIQKKYMYGPVMVQTTVTRTKKVYDLDPDGKKLDTFNVVQAEVQQPVVDKEATKALYEDRDVKCRVFVEEFAAVYWAFVYETFGVPPANVNVANIAKLQVRYPDHKFSLSEAEDRDLETEQAAVQMATPA